MSEVLVLNASYEVLTTVTWQRAVTMVVTGEAVVHEADAERQIRSQHLTVPLPRVIRLVTYVFGSKLPPSGRCILSPRELAKLDRGRAELAAYVVEVCCTCNWNHLLQSFPVGNRAGR